MEFDRAKWQREYQARDERIGVPLMKELVLLKSDAAAYEKVRQETYSYLECCSPQEVIELGGRVLDLYSRSRTRNGGFTPVQVDLFASGAVKALEVLGTDEATSLVFSLECSRRAVFHQYLSRLPEPLNTDF